jgi:O-antigen ligase
MLLQLAGLGIIAWAAASTADEPLPKGSKTLLLILLGGLAVVLLQLVPLPPSLWSTGVRARIADGYAILGQPVPWLPISLTPYATFDTLLAVIPPLAMICAILRLGAFRASWLAAALLAGLMASVMLGALQVAASGPNSPWYLYDMTNRGVAVGFFANANHMADLLVVALPFVAALAAAGTSRNIQRYSSLIAILGGATVLILVGIGLNGSLAGYALALPAIAGSVLIFAPSPRNLRVPLVVVAGLGMMAAVVVLASTSIGSSRVGHDATSSVQSREAILKTTAKAISETMPLGSGLGSFRQVYRLYESPDTVTPEYVIHAHNDYAELVLELGVLGAVLIAAFIAWWLAAARGGWRTGGGGPFVRAASIGSAVVLLHSLVDFPLRTAAISATFAMCLALLIDRRPAERRDPNDLRPTRHLVVN